MTANSIAKQAQIGSHAIVLGASMAGLLAARVLADFYPRVTVVERDTLCDTATVRRGVPQGRHAHGLLMRGAQALEELFPDRLDELVDGGAALFDGTDLSKLYFCMNGHLAVRVGASEGLRTYSMTRPFLECHVRRRLRAIPNITVLDDHDVADICVTAQRRVTGVRVVSRSTNVAAELTCSAGSPCT